MSREKGIQLSKKHGLNPSLDHCWLCGKEIGIVLFGRLKGDAEAPHKTCSGNVCNDCKKRFEKESVVLSCNSEGDTDGRMIWIPKECITEQLRTNNILRMINTEFDKTFKSD